MISCLQPQWEVRAGNGTAVSDLATFAGYCKVSKDRIGARKQIRVRKGAFTGGLGGGCPVKGKVDRLEMLVGHKQCGACLDRNFFICLFADRN